MHVVIFEGSRWSAFAPLSLSRPVFGLGTGATSLLEKQLRHLRPQRLTLWVRPEMEEFCRQRIVPHLRVPVRINEPLDDEPALLFNGRTVHLGGFESMEQDSVVVDESSESDESPSGEQAPEVIRLAYTRRPGLSAADVFDRSQRWLDLLDLPHAMPQARLVDSVWDLIHWNDESLIEDYARLHVQPSVALPAGPFHFVNPDDVWLSRDVHLEPGCVLDASRGPVMIDMGATIGANAVIKGPCFIGPHARVRPLTQIREGVSIGTLCTVGGEISHSIILDYSNKAHEGYLGHSYVGKWVNLGSGTTTSNLKNTYGHVRARIGNREAPTGRQFLGSAIGDHSKTAILTRLSAGTYVGFCSMIVSPGPAPRLVPSFTFLTETGPQQYQMEKAMEVTRRVFARRDRQFTALDESVMRYVSQIAPSIEK